MCLCVCVCALTLCDPLDCSLPGSSVHGILQARTLEWVAPMLAKIEGRRRREAKEDEMVGWHHELNGHEFEQTPGDCE